MDTSEQYIKMCDYEEIQGQRLDNRYPEFPLRRHENGDYLSYTDLGCITFTMDGGKTPPQPATGIYICGSEQVQGSHIPNKEQYLSFVSGYKKFKDPLRELIWLPRQDQLQEMVRGEKHMHLLAHLFALWCHGGEDFGKMVYGFPNCLWSMEQLWLAFVMKEKFNKVWSGDRWE